LQLRVAQTEITQVKAALAHKTHACDAGDDTVRQMKEQREALLKDHQVG
jgi:hypothetical protein